MELRREQIVGRTGNIKMSLKQRKENFIVNGVESRRQIEKNKGGNLLAFNAKKKVVLYAEECSLSRMKFLDMQIGKERVKERC